jgi:hypothetical protein
MNRTWRSIVQPSRRTRARGAGGEAGEADVRLVIRQLRAGEIQIGKDFLVRRSGSP